MPKTEPKIDAYIEKSADFARPVLEHFRKLIHQACPDVEEKWKWSFPNFDYYGAPLAHMAAFKAHCSIGFWKAALMRDNDALMKNMKGESAMGNFGKITSLKDLPPKSELIRFIHEGMRLNEMGIKLPARKSVDVVEVPDYFHDALAGKKNAIENFNKLSNSHRKEYVMWITEAKTEGTRVKRIMTAIEWIAEGKNRNWKYEKKI